MNHGCTKELGYGIFLVLLYPTAAAVSENKPHSLNSVNFMNETETKKIRSPGLNLPPKLNHSFNKKSKCIKYAPNQWKPTAKIPPNFFMAESLLKLSKNYIT